MDLVTTNTFFKKNNNDKHITHIYTGEKSKQNNLEIISIQSENNFFEGITKH